jgi:uracil phosphoribosyltransferase
MVIIFMGSSLERHLETILSIFPVDVSSTENTGLQGLDPGTRIFKVDPRKSPLIPKDAEVGSPFIVDTSSGREIACHPHIVGERLEELCLDCAREFVNALKTLGLFDGENLGILHILRAAEGYRVAEALHRDAPIISVRTEYTVNGYRAHLGDERDVRVTYRDYYGLGQLDEASTILIPDTYATGRSAEAALRDLFESGFKPRRIVLYGFIAISALVKLGQFSQRNGVGLTSFSICDISQLAHNNYDMPLYGLDESLYSSNGELARLGSIVDVETLREFLPRYVAGLDQPGDWSERQTTLFDGYGNERGDISHHLRNSMRLIEALREINPRQPWYNEYHDNIALKEMKRLRETLREYERLSRTEGL